MDGSINGDTKWFTENEMETEFENAIRKFKQGEIFTVETHSQNDITLFCKHTKTPALTKMTAISVTSNYQ